MFTTSEQRSALDEIRAQEQFAQPDVQPDEPQEAAPISAAQQQPSGPTISSLTINGVVRRSGGKTMVWVNGHEVERGNLTRDGVLVESAQRGSGDVRLRLPSGTESIALRPGQKIDVGSGLVLEPYEVTPAASGQSAFAVDSQAATSALDPAAQAPPAGVAKGLPQAAGDATPAQPPLSADVMATIDALRKAMGSAAGAGAAPRSP